MSPHELHKNLGEWLELDPDPRPPFHDFRVQLHWMAQCVGAFGEAMVEPQPDSSHTSMHWDEQERGLLGMPARDGIRVGLALASPAFYVKDSLGMLRGRLDLTGQTLASGMAWITETTSELMDMAPPRPLVLPEYAMPDHALAGGATFGEFDPGLGEQVARWYGNTVLALELAREQLGDAGAIRCWPHHFDMALHRVLDPEHASPDKARSIGCGLSLGDESVPEPYFYCNPWPRPLGENLPALEGRGSWHVKGWVGALLRSGDLAERGSAQASQVNAFFASAIAVSRQLLGVR